MARTPAKEPRSTDTLRVDPERLTQIQKRWRVQRIDLPGLLRPCRVRILFYADFSGAYNGLAFDGLKHVIATLKADPYFWVRFELTLANRVADPSADPQQSPKKLNELPLQDFDQVWFFGFRGLPDALSAAEKTAVSSFMDGGGGVLVTGDHADLGAAIGSGLPRAGKMRRWANAPSQGGVDRHSTLRAGHDPGFEFEDQSDDVPQVIRPQPFPVPSVVFWQRRTRPHPVLCGPDGPIDVLPDHMHEGEAIAPTNLPAAEWPSTPSGVQQKPEVIAWATVIEPGLDKTGQEFGVISAYDGHPAGVGRIVADATWHHWFDINLIGDRGAVVGDTAGFDATPAGQAVLKKIEAYFLNVAVWLARPPRQTCMRNRLWWGGVWRDPLIMMSPTLPVYVLGGYAIDALGKYAPHCTVIRWVWDFVLDEVRKPWQDVLDLPDPPPPFLEECVLGAALRSLLTMAHERGAIPTEPPSDKDVERMMSRAFDTAFETGLTESLELAQRYVATARRLSAVVAKRK